MMLVRRITSSLLLAALLLPAGVLAQREPTVQKDLRERFGEWAERFPAEMANYTALETIEQVRWDRRGQQTTPIVAMFRYTWRRAGEKQELVESRSVVKESDLPSGVSASSLVSAARAGSAFGNHPHDLFEKLPLMVTRMALRNHERIRYFFVPDEAESTGDNVVIGYRQIGGTGLMVVERKDVFPSGRAWIDPDDGRLVRIEEEFSDRDTRYTVAIDNAVGEKGWLPERITVRLFEKGRLIAQNVHTYTDIRKLTE